MALRLARVWTVCSLALSCSISSYGQGDFSIVASPSSQTVWQAQNKDYLVTVTPAGGFSGTVSFAVSGLPTGATASFNPATVAGSGTTTMTIAASPGTPTGTSNLTITGTSGVLNRTTPATLTVVVPPPITYTYDAVGRLTSVTDQWGSSAFYRYDSVGNLLSISRADNTTVTVQAFAPASGLAGSSVTILGSGFSTTIANNTVKFNGVTATVTSSTATVLVATVPGAATTGPVSVTVGGNTASSSSNFTVASTPAGPTITSFTPSSGAPSTPITITGTNFFTNPAANTVKIGATTLTVLSATATTITTGVPPVSGSGKISVQTPSGTVTSGDDFIFVPSPFRTSDVVLSARANLGTFYSMKFTASGQAAVLIFDGTAGQKVRFMANCSKANNLVLYDPNGASVMTDTPIGVDGSIIETPPLSNGTYTLLIKGPISTSIFPAQWSLDLGRTTIGIFTPPSPSDFGISSLGEIFRNYDVNGPYLQPTYKSGQRFKIFLSLGSSMTVNLSASGLPAGVTTSFSPASTNGNAVSRLEFTVADTVGAGTYPITITGTAGATSHSTTVQLGVNPPPSPWTQTDIQAFGRADHAGGTYTMLAGYGGNFFWTDDIHYVNQPLTSDGSLVVRVASISYEQTWISPVAYGGVMIRDSNSANANRMFLRLRSDTGLELETQVGGVLTNTAIAPLTTPLWLKIVRQGGNVASFYSQDGATWTQAGGTVALSPAAIGFAGGTGVFGSVAEILFDNVTLSTAPDFFLTATPASQSAIPGQQTTYVVNVSALAGFNGAVSLSIPPASLPAGTTASFNPASVTGSGQSTLTVTTNGSTPSGSFTLPVTGTSDATSRIATVKLITSPDFTISVSPASRTTNIGTSTAPSTTTYTVTVSFLNGLSTPISLSAAGLPTGVTGVFAPSSLSANGSSTLTLTIGANTPQRTYNFTVTGKSGALTHSVTAALVITTADFAVTLDSSSLGLPSTGGSGTRTVTISPSGNFSKTVTLSVTSLPAGATASFNPTAIAPGTPSTLTITTPGGLAPGSYGVSVVGTVLDQAAGNPTRSTTLTLLVQPAGTLPAGWTSADIGATGLPTSTGYTAGTFTIQASNNTIGGPTDSCRFVYQTLSGDGSILVDLTRIQNPIYQAQYGLMIRETLAASDRHAVMLIQNGASGNDAALFGARMAAGASITWTGGPTALYSYNRWLKLVRSGSTITGYVSLDGFNWGTAVGSATFSGPSLATNLFIGLFVGANSVTASTTADFYNTLVTAGTAGDFHLAPFPVTQTVPTVASFTSHTIRIDPVNGFTGTAALTAACPGLATCSLSSSSVAAGGFANLRIALPAGLAPGPYTATVTATSGALTRTAAITVTVSASAPLPAPWTADNIGSILSGTTSYDSGVFSATSTGDAIFGTTENFRYTYQPLTGDAVMVLRVLNYTYWGQAHEGIMIRETLEPDSPKVMVSLFSNGGPASGALQYRSTKGGNTIETIKDPPVNSLPFWLKLVRQGNLFSGYSSSDGTSWTQIGSSVTVPMASIVNVGVATTSGSATNATTATFDNVYAFSSPTSAPDFSLHAVPSTHAVDSTGGMAYYNAEVNALNGFTGNISVTATSLPPGATATTVPLAPGASGLISITAPPLAVLPYAVSITGTGGSVTRTFPVTLQVNTASGAPLPAPWAHLDIGSVNTAGSASYSNANSAYSVNGSGNYIFYNSDSFHFAYQPLSGDATLIGRFASTGLAGTAKAGLMIRESLASISPNVLVAKQNINNALFQWRSDPGGVTGYNNPPPTGKPWIKLVRQASTNSFSGYHSDDGVTWTQLGATVNIPMRSSVFAGIAAGENANGLTTVTLDNLLIVSGPDFRLLTPVTTRVVGPGAKAIYTINPDPLNGFSGLLTFSVAGLPTGAASSFTPATWSGSGSVYLEVTAPTTVTPGDYPLTITATGAGKTHMATVTLTLRGSGFTISPTAFSPASIISAPTTNPSSTITLAPVGGFTGAVTLTATGIPSATLSFTAPTLTTSGTTTLTVLTTDATPGGNHNVLVTATGPDGTEVAMARIPLVIKNYRQSIYPSGTLGLRRGDTYSYTIFATPENSFNQGVTLTYGGGLPSGNTVTFSSNPINGSPGWQSTMTVKIKNTSPTGTYTGRVYLDTAGAARRTLFFTIIILQ